MIVSVPPGGWFIDYVDVPPGYTNLTFYATNLPPTINRSRCRCLKSSATIRP